MSPQKAPAEVLLESAVFNGACGVLVAAGYRVDQPTYGGGAGAYLTAL